MEKTFDFWQDHSDTFLTMAYHWDRRKPMQNPDGVGSKTGDCGDTITFYLAIEDDIIKAVNFEIDGCLNTCACCNSIAHLVEGKSVREGWEITSENVIEYLETLPADHYHCAELAVGTLYLALSDTMSGSFLT